MEVAADAQSLIEADRAEAERLRAKNLERTIEELRATVAEQQATVAELAQENVERAELALQVTRLELEQERLMARESRGRGPSRAERLLAKHRGETRGPVAAEEQLRTLAVPALRFIGEIVEAD